MATKRGSGRGGFKRGSAEHVAKIMAERGVDAATAKKIARGHGSTPEHGKVRSVPVSTNGAGISVTRSGQAAMRVIKAAAKAGERVSIRIKTKDGADFQVYTNPSGPRRHSANAGMSAKHMVALVNAYAKANNDRAARNNLFRWLRTRPWVSPEKQREYDEAGVPPLDILEVEINAYPKAQQAGAA